MNKLSKNLTAVLVVTSAMAVSSWGQSSNCNMPLTIHAGALPQITFRAPLVSVNVACAALELDSRAVVRLIESRALPWAFDLALESRREIRLLAASLHHFQQPAAPRVGSFAEAIEIIFPTMTAARVGVVSKIKAIQIARRFSVKGDHVLRLGDAGWLSFVPGTKRHAGISPEILFSSVSGFLRRRRIA